MSEYTASKAQKNFFREVAWKKIDELVHLKAMTCLSCISVVSHKALHDGLSGPLSDLDDYKEKMVEKIVVAVRIGENVGKLNNEGLPLDFWAWRKYGQNPIKGSPYPRSLVPSYFLVIKFFQFERRVTFMMLGTQKGS
ncbi:hypothetical protein JHK87_035102 [Glycine soja]|nr:hypothetical protein JHK87_035102 [Glycine soja]